MGRAPESTSDTTVNGGLRTRAIDSSNTTALTTTGEDLIFVDTSSAAVTVTLAANDLSKDLPVRVFNVVGTNDVTVDTEGAEAIDPDGDSSKTVSKAGWGIAFHPDGSNWDSSLIVEAEQLFLPDRGSDPSNNGELQRNGTDVKVQTGGTVKNLSNLGTGGSNRNENTLSDTGKAQLLDTAQVTADVTVIDESNDEVSTWFLRGTNNDAQKLFDSNTHFTNTEGNNGTVNVYWDGGNTRYEVENQTGGQITVAAIDVRET